MGGKTPLIWYRVGGIERNTCFGDRSFRSGDHGEPTLLPIPLHRRRLFFTGGSKPQFSAIFVKFKHLFFRKIAEHVPFDGFGIKRAQISALIDPFGRRIDCKMGWGWYTGLVRID